MAPRTETYTMAGRPVRRVGFGAMQLPGPGVFGPPKDRQAAIDVLRRAVELGVNHIDTSQYYGPDVSNELIHAALHPYPDDLVFASKVGARRDETGGWPEALSPEELVQGVHDNLKSLELERIDVVNLRIPEGGTEIPLPELLGPLIELKDQGLIGGIGVSTVNLSQYTEAASITEIAQVQNRYSVANREWEDILIETEKQGVAFVPYFPLGSAFSFDNVLGDPVVTDIAGARQNTPAQVALAWLLHHANNILLIPGTSSIDHLQENLAVADIHLQQDEIDRLDAVAGS
jgi:pyridoxine 4-dehydrogenase